MGRREPAGRPPWSEAPSGTLPGIASLGDVLAQSAVAVIYASSVAAYPLGFELTLIVVCRDRDIDFGPEFLGMEALRSGERRSENETAREALWFAMQYADGTRVTNARLRPDGLSTVVASLSSPSGLRFTEGHGSEGQYELRYWIWPLPPHGPLVIESAWPAASLGPSRIELDAAPIIDAAAHARVIFDRS